MASKPSQLLILEWVAGTEEQRETYAPSAGADLLHQATGRSRLRQGGGGAQIAWNFRPTLPPHGSRRVGKLLCLRTTRRERASIESIRCSVDPATPSPVHFHRIAISSKRVCWRSPPRVPALYSKVTDDFDSAGTHSVKQKIGRI
jgi:hypothetical protein